MFCIALSSLWFVLHKNVLFHSSKALKRLVETFNHFHFLCQKNIFDDKTKIKMLTYPTK